MRWLLLLSSALLASHVPPTLAQSESMQQSHIGGHVPEKANFHAFMKRDLLAYLRQRQGDVGEDVQIELLREEPTQSGVAYPKYYAWVKFKVGVMKTQQGAVRLAAIDRLRFEVTDFVTAAQAEGDRQAVERVFPRALIPAILAKAAQR